MKTISLCMITKDEEANIERCLKSVDGIVDEIIIVDTGSTDKTIEIAKNWGAKVYNHTWNNNFSEARNVSLEKATKDWILFLDADEELSEYDGKKIKFLIENENKYEAYYLRLGNIIDGVDVGDSIVLRIFKNNPKYRFKGIIHEQVVKSIQEEKGSKCIGSTDIRILHYGYDPNITDIKKKHERNINLLLNFKEEKDGYYYYVLGNEYARADDLNKAYSSYKESLKLTNLKNKNIYYPYLILNIAKIHSSAKKFGQGLKFIHSIQSTVPNFKDLYFMECISYIECGKLSKALEALDNYTNCPIGYKYGYPNNKFQNIYNIEHLRDQILNNMVTHEENILSGLMVLDEDIESIDFLVETIKSINEITSNVVVVIDNDKEIDIEKIKSIGAQVVETKEKDKKFLLGLKQCRGSYVILINQGDLYSIESKKEIIKLLEKSNNEAFNLLIMNKDNNDYTSELRIIKNNKKVN